MTATMASIDIGSYTTRLLVAGREGPSGPSRSLLRKRVYTRLSKGFDYSGRRILLPEAIERTLEALSDFSREIERLDVPTVYAVATGVVRDAVNRKEFLDRILEHTGLSVRLVSGEEEALLTGKGALSAVPPDKGGSLVFDLGGGSTEFFFSGGSDPYLGSLPLGASVLTERFFKSDPPREKEVDSVSEYIDRCLDSLTRTRDEARNISGRIIGTGGTITTLSAMLLEIPLTELTYDSINGCILSRRDLQTLFSHIRHQDLNERLNLPGLDSQRAQVILAGSLVVMKILDFFGCANLTASMADLLEGLMIDHFEGEKNE
ncbi:MAG: exopolyphosphatase [Thermodesulfobacteriota bacterium]|nr:exopolyphosphatase [Thermodesulfobacteriota bacterium]